MDSKLEKRLALVLFLCKVSVILVILVWSWDKFVRPEHGAGIMKNFYAVGGLSNAVIIAAGAFQVFMCGLYFLGFFKRWVALYFLIITAMPLFTQRLLNGLWVAIVKEPHPTILLWTTFSMLACAFAVYYLRDYDTFISLNKASSSEPPA